MSSQVSAWLVRLAMGLEEIETDVRFIKYSGKIEVDELERLTRQITMCEVETKALYDYVVRRQIDIAARSNQLVSIRYRLSSLQSEIPLLQDRQTAWITALKSLSNAQELMTNMLFLGFPHKSVLAF
jgi:hypothetical protein